MLKTHLKYLRKAVTIAANTRTHSVATLVGQLRASSSVFIQMIRDIVCDPRFFSVLESDDFWVNYACEAIRKFIDSISLAEWQDEKKRTGRKEEFLNEWILRHILPLTSEQYAEIVNEFFHKPGEIHEDDHFGMNGYRPEHQDMTDDEGEPGEGLPEEMNMLKSNSRGAPGFVHDAEATYLDTIDPQLVKLAKEIGRCGGAEKEVAGKFQNASRSDISGVTVGDDLNCLLPSELALLAGKPTEAVFFHKFAQKRLQIFSSASRSYDPGKKKTGPIFICVDTSGSMTGEPEKLAKTLALAIAILVQKDRRPICFVNYCHEAIFFVLTDYQRQKQKFLKFLSHSYGGGNNEDMLFKFLFKELPSNAKYAQFKHNFDNADLLIVSDFFWGGIGKEAKILIDKAREEGMLFYGLCIGEPQKIEFDGDVVDDIDLNSGFDFFNTCDHRYCYYNQKLKKLMDKDDETENAT